MAGSVVGHDSPVWRSLQVAGCSVGDRGVVSDGTPLPEVDVVLMRSWARVEHVAFNATEAHRRLSRRS